MLRQESIEETDSGRTPWFNICAAHAGAIPKDTNLWLKYFRYFCVLCTHTVNQQALLPISPTSGLHVCICPAVSPATLQASAPWCWDSVHAAETNWSGSWRQWHCWPMASLSALPKSSSQPIFRWYPCQYPMQEILEKIGDSNVNVPMSGFLQGFWC